MNQYGLISTVLVLIICAILCVTFPLTLDLVNFHVPAVWIKMSITNWSAIVWFKGKLYMAYLVLYQRNVIYI